MKAFAKLFTVEAIESLVAIARASARKQPQAAVAAWKEVLDRGNGKVPQAVTGEGGGPVRLEIGWQA